MGNILFDIAVPRKRLIILYMVLIHVLLGIVLWKSNYLKTVTQRHGIIFSHPRTEITSYYYCMLTCHHRSVDIVSDNVVIVIGDSLTQGLCVSAIAPNSVNYGIGSDTTFGVLQRIPIYMPALKRAQIIVIAIGTNDFKFRSIDEAKNNYKQILQALPDSCITVVSSVLPVDENVRDDLAGRNLQINEFNCEIKKIASKHVNIVFINNTEYLDTNRDSFLDRGLHIGDGVHLNSKGNALWATNIDRIIAESKGKI